MKNPEYYELKMMLGSHSSRVNDVISLAETKYNVTLEDLVKNRELVNKISNKLHNGRVVSKTQHQKNYNKIRKIYK